GDQFLVFRDEKQARQIGESRQQKHIVESRGSQTKISLDDLFEQIKQGEMKDLNVIIKADVQGSAEALAASLRKIEVETVNINISFCIQCNWYWLECTTRCKRTESGRIRTGRCSFAPRHLSSH